MRFTLSILFSLFFLVGQTWAQNSPLQPKKEPPNKGGGGVFLPMITGAEQDCPNAFPVCQLTYSQPNSYSGQGTIDDEIAGRPTCLGSGEKNGVWYIFTVSASGSLDVTVTAFNGFDDYDMAVYNLTGLVCGDIVTGTAPEVMCDYSSSSTAFGSTTVNFGETYVLYVSNFSSTQSGYNINFSGTASIVDNTPPVFIGVQTPIACGATTLQIQFSENVTCNTISNFDFTLTDPDGLPVTVTGISGANCLGPNSYEDIFTITLTPPITKSGTYVFNLVGTVTDICGQTAAAVTTPFTINLGPPPTIATNSPIACGSSLSITVGAVPAGAPFTITRSDAGFTANGVGPGGTFTDPSPVNGTTYTIQYLQGGCEGAPATTGPISTGTPPSSAFTLPATICAGNSATFTRPPVAGVTYSWSFAGGSPATATGPGPHNVSFASGGTFPITLTSNLAGCTSQTTQNYTVNPGISLTPPAPLSTCAGSTVNFSVSPITGGVTYQWSGPGFSPPSGPTPSFVSIQPVNSGTYTITATNGLCTSSATTTITVAALPNATFTIPTPICDGVGVTFNVPGGNPGGTTYSWTFAGGSPGTSTSSSPSVTWTGFSSATVSLLATGPGPTLCQTLSNQNVTIGAMPSAVFNVGSPLCEGLPITFTGPANPAGTTYAWTFPTGTPGTSTSQTQAVSFSPSGNKTVTLTTNLGGCIASTNQTVTVNPIPGPAAPFSNSPVCEFGTLTLTAEGSARAGATYSWSGPGGFVASGFTVTRSNMLDNATFEGVYTVIVTINGCTSSAGTTTVVVNAFPNPVASSNSPVCAGGSLNLCVDPTPMGPWPVGTTFVWSGPNAFNSPVQCPVRNPASVGDSGPYLATVTVPGCAPVQATTNVTVTPAPTLNAFNNGPICAGSTLQLTASNIAGATYSWSGPNSFSTGTQNPSIASATTLASGIYTVSATVAGCGLVTATTTAVVNAIPSAPTVTSNSPVCVGGTIQLTATGLAGAIFTWSGPLGYTSGPSVSTTASRSPAQVAHSGDYSVTQTVNGCVSPVGTVNVVVNTPPSPTASNDGPACVGESDVVTFSTPTVTGATYGWTGPMSFISSSQNPTLTVAGLGNAGSYVVSVTVPGCPAATASTTLVVNSLVSPAPTNGGPYCAGNTIQLNASGSAGTTYSWSGPNSFTSASQNPSIGSATTSMAGIYTVTSSIAGCNPLSGTTTVVVNNSPVPAPTNNGPLCNNEGDGLQLTSATISGATYSWSGPNLFSSSQQNPSLTITNTNQGGTYVVTVTVPGCGAVSGSTVLVVNSLIAPSPTNSGPHCVGQTLQLTAQGTAGTSFDWTGPASFNSSAQNPVRSGLTTLMAGVYTVTSSIPGCNNLTGNTTVIVNSPPPSQTFSIGPLCSGGSLTLSAPSPPAGVTWTYAWSGPNGFNSVLQNPSKSNITTADAGVYSVNISVAGCSPVLSTTTVTVNAPPVLNAGNNGPLCPGNTLNLTSSSIAGATYSWSGPSGFSSGVQNPTLTGITTPQGGVYTATATIPGCTPVTAQTTVVVNPTPATPSVGNNGPLCVGDMLQLNGPFVAGATYAWSGPNGFNSSAQSPSSANIQMVGGGTYVLVVTVLGCPSLPGTTNVVVNPLPASPILTNNSPLCTGGTLQLTSNFVSGGSYSWSGPSGFASNAQNPARGNVTVLDGGVYQATVTVLGCTSLPGSTTVVVNPVPAAPLTGNNGPLCAGSTLQLTSETIVGATYAWTGPNGFVSNAQNPTIASVMTSQGGTYSVVATVNGCPSSVGTTTAIVFGIPLAPSAANNGPICSGNTLELYAPQVLGGTYSWSGPLSFTSNAQNPVIASATTNMSGTYQVFVTVNGCTSPGGSTTVVVNGLPSAPVIGNNSPLCTGSSLNLTAAPIAGAQYSWSGPQTFQSIAQNPTVAPVETVHAGTYFLVVTVNGCTSPQVSTNVVVNVSPAVPAVSNNSPVCAGSALSFSTPLLAGGSYAWVGPNGFSSFVQNPSIASASMAANGAYSLQVTLNGCSSAVGITQAVVNAIPVAPGASSNSPVCEGGTLSLQSGTVAFATYSWSGPNSFSSGSQNPVLNNVGAMASGVYSVRVTVNGCSSSVSVTTVSVTTPPVSPPVLQNNGPLCVGASLQLTSSTVAGATSYMWTGPNGFNSLNQNPVLSGVNTFNGGAYSLTVTVGPCVLSQQTTLVIVNALPTAPSAGNNGPLCVGGLLQLTSSFVSGATYSWSGPSGFMSNLQNPATPIGSTSNYGVYSVTVTIPGLGCTSSAGTTSVTGGGLLPTPSLTSNSPLCAGSTLQLTGPTVSGATYMWTGPNGYSSSAQNPMLSNAGTLQSGVYSLVVQVGACMSQMGMTTVMVNPIPSAPIASNNGPVCAGSPLSLFASTVSGGSYTWSGPLGYGAGVQNPVIGSPLVNQTGVYSVRVTVNGCTSNFGVTTVVVKASPSAPTAGSNSPLCEGQTLQLTASFVAGATYMWSGPGSFSSTLKNPVLPNANGGMSGLYSVSVTVNGCTSAVTTTNVVVNGANFVPTLGSNAPLCMGSNLNLSTSTIAGASYSWSGPNGFSSNLQNPVIVGAGSLQNGVYSLVVTTSGCTSQVGTTSIVVNMIPSAPGAGSNSPVCVGGNLQLNASTVSGATYMWSGPGGFSSALQNPVLTANAGSAGVYSVSVMLNGCTSAVATTTVVVNAGPSTPTASNNGPLCSGPGDVTLQLTTPFVSGGSYMWTGPNGFTSNLQNPILIGVNSLNAGVYSVVVSVAGCMSMPGMTSVSIGTTPVIGGAGADGPVCAGSTLSLTSSSISGATYMWSGPNGFTSAVQNPVISNISTLGSGLYTVVASIGGCASLPMTTNVLVKPVPSAPVASNGGAICAGETLILSASDVPGGVFMWSGPNGFTFTGQNPVIVNASSLATGAYSVIVTLNGCTSSAGVTSALVKGLPTAPVATNNGPVCEGSDLILSLVPQAGATYMWSGPNNFSSNAASPIISGVSFANAGVYSVMATISGCTGSASGMTTVVVNAVPSAPTVGNNGPVCAGGTLQLSASGVAGATYMWVGPNGFSSSLVNPNISNASALNSGSYGLTIMVNGCTSAGVTTTAVVNGVPTAPSASSNSPVCAGGQLQLSASPILGASFMWSGPNGFSSMLQNPVITNVTSASAGVYAVVATLNGCMTSSSSVSVVVSPVPSAPVAGNSGPVCAGSTLSLTSSSISGATYQWSGPGFSSSVQNPVISGITTASSGVYTVIATVGGCASAPATTSVTVNGFPTGVTISSNSPLCAGGDLALNTGMIAGATYMWTGPAGFMASVSNPQVSDIGTNGSGVYSLVVSIGGCTSGLVTSNVVVNAIPNAPTATNNGPICSGATLQLTAGAISGASYSWTGPNGFVSNVQNPVINNVSLSANGTYSVVLTLNGCTSPAGTVSVTVANTLGGLTSGNSGPVCAGQSVNLTASSITGAVYMWSGPNGFSSNVQNPVIGNAQASNGGVYTVTATLGACSAISTSTLTVKPVPTVVASSNSPVCEGGALNLGASTISGATYAWSGPNSFSSGVQNPVLSSVTPLNSGVYTVIATLNGCASVPSVTTVAVRTKPGTPSPTNNGALCIGSTLNLSTAFVSGGTYMWTGPNGFSSNIQNPILTNVSLLNAGVYSLTVSVAGCMSSVGTTAVVINGGPSVTSGNNGPICVGQSLSLTASTLSGATYMWSGPNGFVSNVQNPVIINAGTLASGAYAVVATVNGCASAPALTTVLIKPLPVISSASSNSPICSGQNLNLQTSLITGASYSWSGPGFSSTVQNPVISNASTNASGVYQVVATLNGCASAPVATSVQVNGVPAAPSVASNGPLCVGANLQLTANGASGVSYSWSGPNGFSSNVQNPVISNVGLNNGGLYALTVSMNGCTSAAGTVSVVVNAAPVLSSAGSNSPVCAGGSLQLNASLVSGGIYSWVGPNGFSAGVQNPVLNNANTSQSGAYIVTVSQNGCVSSPMTVNVQVNDIPAAPVASNQGPVCVGGSLQLNASLVSGASYVWSGPNGFSSNVQNPVIMNIGSAQSGVYSVKSLMNGCMSGASTTTVVVNALPTGVLSGTFTSCAGSGISLPIVVTGKGPWTISWTGPMGTMTQNFGDVNSASPSTFTWSVSPTSNATYLLTHIVDGNGCTGVASGTATVTVGAVPTASVVGVPSGSSCAGGTVNVPVQFTGMGPWTLNYMLNGVPQASMTLGSSGSPSPSVFNVPVLVTTNSTVSLTTVASGNGCTNAGSGTFTATVLEAPTASWGASSLEVCLGSNVFIPVNMTGTGPWTVNYMENGVSHSLTLGNAGSPSPSVIEFSVSPTVNSTYSLISVISGNGCMQMASGSLNVTVKPLPSASMTTGNMTICGESGANIGLVLTGVGPWMVDYTFNGVLQAPWTVNSSPATMAVTPSVSGVYVLSSVMSANGCSGNVTGSANITLNPVVSANLTGGGSTCAGGSVPLTLVLNGKGPWTVNYTSNGVVSPAWVLGNANSASPSVFVVTVSPTENTVYALLNVVDGNGCSGTATGASTVTLNGLVSANFVGTQTEICSGGSTNLAIMLMGMGPWSVDYTANGVAQGTITFGDGGSASPATFTLPVAPLGSTTYSLTSITDGTGCTGGVGGPFMVKVVPTPTATLAGTNVQVCTGGTSTLAVTLTGQGPWTVGYTSNGVAQPSWTLGNANSASGSTFMVTVTPSASTTYALTSVGTGSCAGSASGVASVTVNALPTAVYGVGSATSCSSAAPVSIPVTVTGVGPWTLSYTSNGVVQAPMTVGTANSPSPSTFNVNLIVSTNTTFTLTGVSSGNGCTNGANSSVMVQAGVLPTAAFVGGNQTICAGSTATLPVTVTGQGPWTVNVSQGGVPSTFTLGSANSGSPSTFNLTFSPVQTTLITLTSVTSGAGCVRSLSSRVTVTVAPVPTGVLSGGTTICAGQSASLSFTFTGAGPWTAQFTANGVVQTATFGSTSSPSPSMFVQTVSPLVTTTYALTGVSSGSCTGTFSGSAIVNVSAGPALSIVSQSPAQCGVGGSVTVSGALSYSLNGVTNTSGVFTNLSPGVYTILGTDGAGCPGVLTVTIGGGAQSPTITSISNVVFNSADVSWSSVPGAVSYTVQYRVVGSSGSFTTITGLTGLTTNLSGLLANTQYEVKVSAVCSGGVTSPASDLSTFTTPAAPGCGTPSGLTVTATSTTSAQVNWAPIQSGAVCYIVSYGASTANESTWTSLLVPHPASTLALNNLTPGVTYGVRIRTNCTLCSTRSGTRSNPSAMATFTTPSAKGEGGIAAESSAIARFSVYPNPTRGMFTFRYESSATHALTLTLTDVTGRILATRTLEAQVGATETVFDLSSQSAGVYLLKLDDGTTLKTTKVVVR